MARVTRLELATSGVTGRRSNQLSYTRICTCMGGEAAQVEELCISVNYTLCIIPHISDPRGWVPDVPPSCVVAAGPAARSRATVRHRTGLPDMAPVHGKHGLNQRETPA